jgi:hypothetical protein
MKKTNTVQVRRDGVARSDGRPMNMNPTPRAPGHNVTTQSGRHATGQALARPGTQRAGQGPHTSGMTPGTGHTPKTASRSAMRPKAPVRATGSNAFPDAQRQVTQPPAPFANPQGAKNVPTGRHDGSTYGVRYNVEAPVNAKPQSYGTLVGCGNTSDIDYAAIGTSRAEIMAARGSREQDSVRGVRGNQRQTGMPGTKNANTTARANARMRQRPGGF